MKILCAQSDAVQADVLQQRLCGATPDAATEEYFRMLLEHVSDLIFVLDAAGHIRYATPSVQGGMGYQPEEIAGKNILEFIHPDDVSRFSEAFSQGTLAPGVPTEPVQTRTRHRDGAWRYLDWVARAMIDSAGNVTMIACARDVTDRTAAEQKVLESEQALQGILSASPIGIGRVRNRIVQWVNQSFVRMLGYSLEEVKDRNTRMFFESEEVFERAGRIIYDEGQAEVRLRRKDGEAIDVFLQVAPADSHSYIFTVSDISRRKKAEGMLRFMQAGVDRALDAIMLLGRRGEIVYVNDSGCAQSGYSREELLSMTMMDLDWELSEQTYEERWIFKREKGALSFEARHRHKDGHFYPVEVSSSRVEYDGNEYACVILRDIAERQRVEKALRESEERARMKLDSILSPGIDISDEDLLNIIDTPAIQSLMNDFRRLTSAMMAIVDLRGNILISTGFQEVCDRYHRVHPATAEYCRESRASLTERVQGDAFVGCRCKNNMWEFAAPLFIGGKHAANVLVGQFFYDDDAAVDALFAVPAGEHGFDREPYLKALHQVPRLTHAAADALLDFTLKFSTLISKLSYSNVQLARTTAEQRQAADALRANEMRYRTLFDAANDAIFILKGDVFVDCNATTASMFGCAKGDIIGRHSYTFSPPFQPDGRESRVKAIEKMERALAGEPQFYEWRHARYDGTLFDTEVSLNAVTIDGELLVQAIVRDVTERMQARENLSISEQRYRALFDDSPIALFEIDGASTKAYVDMLAASGVKDFKEYFDHHPDEVKHCAAMVRVIDVNRAAAKLFEAEDSPDTAQNIASLFFERAGRLFKWELAAIADGKNEFEAEAKVLTVKANRISVYLKWNVVAGCESSHSRVLISMIDISERKRAERALRESEEKYRDIFENAVEGIFQSMPDGTFLSVNPAFAHTLGYESSEELLASPANIGGQMYADIAERQRFINALEASDKVLAFERELVRKDGKTIWVSVNARRKTAPDGKTLYYEGTTENITERRQAEEERARLQLQLRQSQKMEAIGTLAGGVAHDFNNILTVLTGYGTLLQMRMDKSNPLRMYVDQIMAASMKAANLTQSLLAFSRQQPIALSPLDVNETIKGTEKLLKRLLTEDIVLKTDLTPEPQMVMADRTQIDQILFNLATNARDAMPKGGTLTIKTSLVDLDSESSEAHGFAEAGRYLLLSVTDTGVGMDEVTKEKVFEPFFTTKEVGKGTGLGLATVYGIVKQHNGQIVVASERNAGTTFRIYLPIIKVAEEKDTMRRKRIKKGNETILIAEDNEAVRGLMREMLNTHGYTVVEAADGKEAIDRFRKNKDIRLLVLDSVMPKKNGREVYDTISAIRPGIRVVFTSGYTRDVVLDKGIEDKRFDFISKPIVKDKLLEKVREVLDRV